MTSRLRRLKKERRIDATVSFLFPASHENLMARCGDRIITSERANPKKYMPEQFWRTRILYALSDHVVFQSELVRGYYGAWTRSHSSVIRNPVTVACTADPVRRHRVVTMGRVVEQKNHRMLIRSFAAFHRDFPEYTLSIYGWGDLTEELQGLIGELGAEDCITLEGNVRDIHERIRDAEMFVLSSNYEGLSNALLECMTMGIACISTKCEGSTDVIRDGENGLLTEIGDEQGLADAMRRLASDPALRRRLEQGALEEAKNFTPERIVKQWEEVIFGYADA